MIPENRNEIDHNLTVAELDAVCNGLDDGQGQLYELTNFRGACSATYELNGRFYEIDTLFETLTRITRIGQEMDTLWYSTSTGQEMDTLWYSTSTGQEMDTLWLGLINICLPWIGKDLTKLKREIIF